MGQSFPLAPDGAQPSRGGPGRQQVAGQAASRRGSQPGAGLGCGMVCRAGRAADRSHLVAPAESQGHAPSLPGREPCPHFKPGRETFRDRAVASQVLTRPAVAATLRHLWRAGWVEHPLGRAGTATRSQGTVPAWPQVEVGGQGTRGQGTRLGQQGSVEGPDAGGWGPLGASPLSRGARCLQGWGTACSPVSAPQEALLCAQPLGTADGAQAAAQCAGGRQL